MVICYFNNGIFDVLDDKANNVWRALEFAITVFPLIEERSYIFFIDLKWVSYIRGGLLLQHSLDFKKNMC